MKNNRIFKTDPKYWVKANNDKDDKVYKIHEENP